MLIISLSSRYPLTVRGQGNSSIHQHNTRVAAQYLSDYSDQTDYPAKMITTISGTPHSVISLSMTMFYLLMFCDSELGLMNR